MASGLASIIGGLAQGITDFGKSAADMFGGAATNNALTVGLDALLNKKSFEQASADARQRQNDYRKWLYDAKTDKDAAAKGLGTALNGAQAVMDFVPGIGQSAPVNALQGAIGGLADELKFNGENYDLGRAAGRAAIGAGANVAAGGLGKALANSGSKVLSNGVLRGAAAGGLSGAISQGGNAAIEGGNADQILQSAAQGAKFGALMGAGTGGVQSLAGALKNARARSNAPALDDRMEVMAEMAPGQKTVADDMLSPGQKEFFKNSKLRDENGNLIKMYHGTPDGSFTEFNEGSYFTPSKEYADGYQWEGASVLRSNKKAVNPKTYEVYINTEKPFTLSDPKARDIYLNEYIKGGNSMYYDPYTDWTKAVNDLSEVDWTEGEGLREWLKENHPEYDALYLDEGGDGGYGEAEYRWRGNSVVPFSPNQIKDINNLTPTDNVNIMAEMIPENRNWDELYKQLSNEAGAFENENRTPITATPEQLRNRMAEIDAKYGNDLPDEVWNERFALREQQRALENGYSSPYDYYVGESKKRFMQDFEANPDKYKRKMDAIEKQKQAQAALEEDIKNASPRKLAQFQLIQQKNPAPNDTLTWIRSPKDILTWDEAITGHRNGTDEAFSWPDYTFEDALRDQKRNRMTVYSSYPVKGGTFVTPSYQQASDYAGGGRVYSKVIRPNDVAWINGDEGQYAYTRVKADEVNDVMAERTAPGQLGLFDQTTTKAPETGYSQLGLFDQPTQPVTPKTIDIADVNPYAPVNGQVTDTMRDRASEIIDNLALKRQIPDNELFNRIDPATLPKGQQGVGKFLDEAYAKGLSHADIVDMMRETVSSEFDKRLGKTPDKEKLISFIFGDADETAKKEMMDKELGLYVAPETVSESTLNSMARHKISDEIYGNNLSALSAGNRTLRGGYTGALDSVLSERLGIAPGNTYKKTGTYDTSDSLGRFQEFTNNPYKNNIMVKTALNNEDAISTMAHERLHSFQTEAKKLYDQDRYSPEVKNAYDELAKDLKRAKAYKSGKEIRNRYYGRNMAYWRLHDEQEARMLQQYLDAKGYTGSRHHNEKQYLGLEFDDAKITPAFDKFFDKLRELSKKGVALPAILATLGLGGYATQNQEEDENNNGQQI